METIQYAIHFFQIDSGLDVEVFKLIFFFSLAISLFVYHQRNNIPVGIIAPGIILLLLGYPIKLLLVIVISALVYISAKILQKYIITHTILAAREKILLLVFLSTIYSFIAYLFFHIYIGLVTLGAVGIVLPAMIANVMSKQNKYEAMKSLGFATIYTIAAFIIVKILAAEMLSSEYKYYLDILYLERYVPDEMLTGIMYLLFSIAVIYNFFLYRIAKLEAVGLLLGSYLGLLLFQPTQIIFLLTVTTISYLITSFIYKHALVYGYRIFVLTASIVAVIYSIVERVAFTLSGQTFHPFFGFYMAGNIAGMLVCSFLVSEAIQYGYKKIASASILMTIILATSLYVAQTISPYMGIQFTVASLLDGNKTLKKPIAKKMKKTHKDNDMITYKETAHAGDSQTLLARRAIAKYEEDSKKTLKIYQKIFMETNLVKNNLREHLLAGDTITYSEKELATLVAQSKTLNDSAIKAWNKYQINYTL